MFGAIINHIFNTNLGKQTKYFDLLTPKVRVAFHRVQGRLPIKNDNKAHEGLKGWTNIVNALTSSVLSSFLALQRLNETFISFTFLAPTITG